MTSAVSTLKVETEAEASPTVAVVLGAPPLTPPHLITNGEGSSEFVVCADSLHVRDKPMGLRIDWLFRGDVVEVVEQFEGWGRIGLGRWVKMSFLCP